MSTRGRPPSWYWMSRVSPFQVAVDPDADAEQDLAADPERRLGAQRGREAQDGALDGEALALDPLLAVDVDSEGRLPLQAAPPRGLRCPSPCGGWPSALSAVQADGAVTEKS